MALSQEIWKKILSNIIVTQHKQNQFTRLTRRLPLKVGDSSLSLRLQTACYFPHQKRTIHSSTNNNISAFHQRSKPQRSLHQIRTQNKKSLCLAVPGVPSLPTWALILRQRCLPHPPQFLMLHILLRTTPDSKINHSSSEYFHPNSRINWTGQCS